jgi:hypothetical protein
VQSAAAQQRFIAITRSPTSATVLGGSFNTLSARGARDAV